MNCDDLTGEEAVMFYEDSLPIEGYRERRLEIMKSRERVRQYEKALGHKVKYDVGGIKVRGDFRGFLRGGGYVIYIGNNTNIYWRTGQNRVKGLHPSNHSKWNFKRDDYNSFGVAHMIEILMGMSHILRDNLGGF